MKSLVTIFRSHRQFFWLCVTLLFAGYGDRLAYAQEPALQPSPVQFDAPVLPEILPVESAPPPAESSVMPVESGGGHPVQMQEYHHYSGPGSTSFYAEPVQYDPSVPEEHEPGIYKLTEGFLGTLGHPAEPIAKGFAKFLHTEHDEPHTELDSHAIGIQPTPPRPDLLLQWNEEFLAPGFLDQGICTPTGAIWRPSLWVFGTYRTGVGYFDNGTANPVAEFANRLDLFTQLNLSGTERILFGLRPLDEQQGSRRDFTGYDLRNGDERDGWNADVQTLFFEGDFGELFPAKLVSPLVGNDAKKCNDELYVL